MIRFHAAWSRPFRQLVLFGDLPSYRRGAMSLFRDWAYSVLNICERNCTSSQADAMIDQLVHGALRIDLGDVNVRKLLADKK